MVKSGEVAGILPDVLERLAAIGREEMELKAKISTAMIYPCVLVSVALVVVIGLMVGVLPKFIDMFEESGAKLPAPTVILLFLSVALRRFWYLFVIGAFGMVYSGIRYFSTDEARYKAQEVLLKIPVLGSLISKTAIARFSRVLGALMKSGVSILQAMEVSREVMGNEVLAVKIDEIRSQLSEGKDLAGQLKASRVFPPMVVQNDLSG